MHRRRAWRGSSTPTLCGSPTLSPRSGARAPHRSHLKRLSLHCRRSVLPACPTDLRAFAITSVNLTSGIPKPLPGPVAEDASLLYGFDEWVRVHSSNHPIINPNIKISRTLFADPQLRTYVNYGDFP